MKNKTLACFTAALLTCTISGIAYTQKLSGIGNNEHQTPLEYNISEPEQLIPANTPGFFYRNDINIKAVRNFIREYKNVAGAEWQKSGNGFVVDFIMNGINTKVFYDKKGNYEWLARMYAEAQLPRDVRHLVKRTFYDFSIYQVLEITRNDNTVYIITMEDKTCWKKIKVENGEIEPLYELPKKLNGRTGKKVFLYPLQTGQVLYCSSLLRYNLRTHFH